LTLCMKLNEIMFRSSSRLWDYIQRPIFLAWRSDTAGRSCVRMQWPINTLTRGCGTCVRTVRRLLRWKIRDHAFQWTIARPGCVQRWRRLHRRPHRQDKWQCIVASPPRSGKTRRFGARARQLPCHAGRHSDSMQLYLLIYRWIHACTLHTGRDK
jgi:hypothetical protein